MKLVNAKNSPWKLTPDMRLQRTFVAGEREQRAGGRQEAALGPPGDGEEVGIPVEGSVF